ncbi:MAG: IS1380 family transposase [Roseateles sp.]
MMPADSVQPGPRYTPPKIKAPDIRDGAFHPLEFVQRMRDAAVADRLQLGGMQRAPTPPALRNLRYVCDQDDLTAFAGMPAFMQFCYALGLADWLAALPIERRCDALYPPGKMGEVIVAILVAGLERVSHIDDVKDDPGLCAALGLGRLPDQATCSRFFSDATEAAVECLAAVNHRFSDAAVSFATRQERLIVDVDTRDVPLYGKQEGTTRSPRTDGDRIYTFEAVTLRNGRDMLAGDLMAGATHPAPLFRRRLEMVLSQIASQTDEAIFCADAAWYADYILRRIERADTERAVPCRCKYAIRAQVRDGLKRAIVALDEDAWERHDEYLEVAEVEFAFTQTRDEDGNKVRGDHPARRYVVTRKRLQDKDGAQEALLDEPRYSYNAIVTSLDWSRKRIVRLYNGRATVESILKESALGFHMDSLPSGSFAGNRVFCQLLVLAYNLVNLFRRLCLPDEAKRQHVPGLRRRLLSVPGRVGEADDGSLLRCSRTGPHVSWLAHLLEALGRWLAPPGLEPVACGEG